MPRDEPGSKMRDPRNQPDGSHDQDKHGRKQNAGSNKDTQRELGSKRDPESKDMKDERARRDSR